MTGDPSRSRALAARVVIGVLLGVVIGAGSCIDDYPSGIVTCDPTVAEPCPAGFQCVDPQREGFTTCVRVACGDGTLQSEREQCDDANANDGDLCHARAPQQIPLGTPGDDEALACREARFCPAVAVGLGVDEGASVELGHPLLVTADLVGNLYVSSAGTNFMSRVDASSGIVTRFAGNGSTVSVVDHTRAVRPNEVGTALLSSIAADGVGNVVLADVRTNVIMSVEAVGGRVVTLAGDGREELSADGAHAVTSPVRQPVAVAVDGSGTVYFLESTGPSAFGLRRIRPDDETIEHLPIAASGASDAARRVSDLDFDSNGDLWLVAAGSDGFLHITASTLRNFSHGVALAAEAHGFAPSCNALCERGRQLDVIAQDQARIAVAPDATTIYFACADTLVAWDEASGECSPVDLGPLDDNCADTGALGPTTPGDASVFTTGLSDVALVPVAGGYELAVADPARGLVRRARFVDGAGGASSEPRTSLGSCTRVDEALLSEALLGFCAETDGRIGVSATEACCPGGNCDAINLLDAERYEFYLPFPSIHVVGRVGCNGVVEIIAGGIGAGFDGDEPRPANGARLDTPVAASTVTDPATRRTTTYIVDAGNERIRRVFVAETDVGGCKAGESCIDTAVRPCGSTDDPATCVFRPAGLVVDASGALVVTDAGPRDGDGRVVRFEPLALDVTAGSPEIEVLEEGLANPASMVFIPYALFPLPLPPQCETTPGAPVSEPCGLVVYVESGGHRVRGLPLAPGLFGLRDPLLFAGNGFGAPAVPGDEDDVDDDPLTSGGLRHPRGLMLDAPTLDVDQQVSATNFLVVDAYDRVRRIGLSTALDPFALASSLPRLPTTLVTLGADGAPKLDASQARDDDAYGADGFLRDVTDLESLDDGTLVVLERGNGRLRVARASAVDDDPAPRLQTVSGRAGGVEVASCLDGVPAEPVPAADAVPLRRPAGLARDGDVLFVGEHDDAGAPRVRRFHLQPQDDPSQWTTDVLCLPAGRLVDARRATLADEAPPLAEIAGLDVDAAAHFLYVADNVAHVVVGFDTAGAGADLVLFAGQFGKRGYKGDGVPDLQRRLAFAETDVEEASKTTYGAHEEDRDAACALAGPPASEALLNGPEGVKVVGEGGVEWLYIADTGNNRVRRMRLDGAGPLETVLGDGSFASGGEGAPANAFPVAAPRRVDVDAWGNLFVTSTGAVRMVAADTHADVCGLSSSADGLADGGDAVATVYGKDRARVPEAATRCLSDVVIDPRSQPGATSVWAVDSCVGMLLRLQRTYDACAAP